MVAVVVLVATLSSGVVARQHREALIYRDLWLQGYHDRRPCGARDAREDAGTPADTGYRHVHRHVPPARIEDHAG